MAVVTGRVGIEHNGKRSEPFFRPEVHSARTQVVVDEVSVERWPVAVQHPVGGHLVVIPSAGCNTFELCTGVLIVGELCLANKILYASGSAVTLLHRQLNITQADIDEILDKISRSGYQNLTDREKKILFEASKKMK